MNKLIKNALQRLKCNPKKFTANVLLVTLAAQWSMPIYAGIQFAKDVKALEDSLNAAARLELAPSSNNYIYKEIFPYPVPDIFDGFDYFYKNASQHNASQFADVKWIPIGVGDITTFIPKAPAKPKFIGTTYVERDIVRLQLNQMLNRSYISSNGLSAEHSEQGYNGMIRLLYKNGLEWFKKNPTVKFGQNLTEAQINTLPKDMIWPEIRELTTGQEIVIPFVYLTQATLAKETVTDTTLDIGSGVIKTHNFYINGGKVISDRQLHIAASNKFKLVNGSVSSDQIFVKANEIENLSGDISGRKVQLLANQITNKTLVYRHNYEHGFSELAGKLATITGIDSLNIYSAGDFTVEGGNLKSNGELKVKAGGKVTIVPQKVRQDHAQQGEHWQTATKSLVNIQSELSAIDLLSIVGNEIYVTGSVLESEGVLELLASEGIYLTAAIDNFSSSESFESQTGGLFGTKESSSFSEYHEGIVETLLKSGQDLVISTEMGPVRMSAVNVESGAVAKILADDVHFEAFITQAMENSQESYSGSLSFRHQGSGFSEQYAHYNEFRAKGGLLVDARNGVHVDIVSGKDAASIEQTLNALSSRPGMEWLAELRNNPEVDIHWNTIQLEIERWDYDNSGLTPAGMAILGLAITAATAGSGGLSIIAGEGAFATAINAGYSAIVTQATGSLLANGFDVGKTLTEIASHESIQNLVTSMVTAGVMQNLRAEFLAGENGLNSYLNEVIENDYIADFAQQSIQSVMHATVSANAQSLLDGEGFASLDFEKIAIKSMAMSAINIVGKELANQIHIAKSEMPLNSDGSIRVDYDSDGNLIMNDPISDAAGYIAHAAVGCVLQGAVSATNGGNSQDNAAACSSGAGGAVVGEYIARYHLEDANKAISDAEDAVLSMISDVGKLKQCQLAASLEGTTCSQKIQLSNETKAYIDKLKEQGVATSALIAGVTVFAFGGNVDYASSAAENALENNALWFYYLGQALYYASKAILFYLFVSEIPDMIRSADAIITAFTSSDPKKRKEARAALEQFAFDVAKEGIEDSVIDKALQLRKWKTAISAMTSIQLLDYLAGEYEGVEFADGVESVAEMVVRVKGNNAAYSVMNNDGKPPSYKGSNGQRKPTHGLTDQDIATMYADHIAKVGNPSISPADFERNIRGDWDYDYEPGGRKWHKPEVLGYIERPNYKDAVINGVSTKDKINPLDACGYQCSHELKSEITIDGETFNASINDLEELRKEAKKVKDANVHQRSGTEEKAFVEATDRMNAISHEIGKLAGEGVIRNVLFKVGENGVKEVQKLKVDYPGSRRTNNQYDGAFLVSYDDGSAKLIIPEYKGGVNPSDSTRVIDGQRYAQGHYKHTQDTFDTMKEWNEKANRMPQAFEPSELRAHNETMLQLEKHKDSASFIKIKTLLNPDGSLKSNGTTIQYKEKAFKPDE